MEKAKAHSKSGGTDPVLEEFHAARAEELMSAGNRLPSSRSNPFRIFDKMVTLEEPDNRMRQRAIEQELAKLANAKQQTEGGMEKQMALEKELSALKYQVLQSRQVGAGQIYRCSGDRFLKKDNPPQQGVGWLDCGPQRGNGDWRWGQCCLRTHVGATELACSTGA